MKVGFIGAGNMAGAILRGMTAGGFSGNDLLVYDTDAAKLAALFEECGVRICDSGTEVAEGADVLLLAVKPQVFPDVLPELAPILRQECPLVISIAAGKTLASIEAFTGPGLPIVRVMPNLNARVGEAMSAFCGNAQVTEEHRGTVRLIFETVGEVMELDERYFSAYSAIAGCSPAFTFLYVDALAGAAVRYGIPKDAALKIAEQAVLGSARLLKESGDHPRALMDAVCSPGGTTIEGVRALVRGGFEAAVQDAVEAALRGWFDGRRLGQSVLRAALGELVFHVEGVANYALTAPAADVAVEADVLPRLGTLAVEAMP